LVKNNPIKFSQEFNPIKQLFLNCFLNSKKKK